MTDKPLEITRAFKRDDLATFIAHTWGTYNAQRQSKINEWKELRNYIFATDTGTTSNSANPWKNSTTLPKLCQIRDNLHSNYLSALFPNDNWLRWEAYDQESSVKEKRDAILAYMSNKTRQSNFRIEVGKMLLDYIDYGNAFGTVEFVNDYQENVDGTRTVKYVGPISRRISPLDIVFNPVASSFENSFKIVRSFVTTGELQNIVDKLADQDAARKALQRRGELLKHANHLGTTDLGKAEGLAVDGFGSYFEYLQSNYVELLTFYGDIHDATTGELRRDRKVIVIDRMWVISDESIPSWLGRAPIFHVGWRNRPDNLWAMGPLDNLVGMQYRIDHLQNAKADAMDIAIHPPLVIKGEVDEFDWMPGSKIHMDQDAYIEELGKNVQWVMQAENEIQALEARMELYAGAPREAMGVRTAGEKTAYEVQQLQNAASRIFQEKINTFEIELLENLLNSMLETARRNMTNEETVRVTDTSVGVDIFSTITKDDIVATGKIRPIGARHFAAQSQLLQNLTGVFNSAIAPVIAPHLSSIKLSELIEDVLGLKGYELFRPNVAIFEQQESELLASQGQEENAMAAMQEIP